LHGKKASDRNGCCKTPNAEKLQRHSESRRQTCGLVAQKCA
jgi:hypothetical protein